MLSGAGVVLKRDAVRPAAPAGSTTNVLVGLLRAAARLDRRVRAASEISPGLVIVVVFGRTAIFYGSRPWKVPPLFDARRGPSRAVSRAWPMGEHSLVRVARTEPVLRPAGAVIGDAARRHYRRRYGWPASAQPHEGNALLFYIAAFTFTDTTGEAFAIRRAEGNLGGILPRAVGEREGLSRIIYFFSIS